MNTEINTLSDYDNVQQIQLRVRYHIGEYEPFAPLWNLRIVLDEQLEQVKGNANFSNGDILDNRIDGVTAQAIADAEKQHIHYHDAIIRFEFNSKANRNACQNRLNLLRDELEDVDQQILTLKPNHKLGGNYNG
jgi:hypothetical protein